MLKITSVMILTIMLAGCSHFFPSPTMYYPPKNTNDVAKVRLMGNPLYYSIRQKGRNGKLVGGFVVEHNRFFNVGFGTTVDIGLPKIQGRDYSGKYQETLVVADQETHINYLAPNCSVTLKTMPKKDTVYEVHYSDTDKSGYCILYIRTVEFDKVNSIYVEGK